MADQLHELSPISSCRPPSECGPTPWRHPASWPWHKGLRDCWYHIKEGVVVNVCSSDLFKSKRAASCLSKRATRFCSNMFVLFVTSHDCAVSQLFLLLCRSSSVRAKIHRVFLLSFFLVPSRLVRQLLQAFVVPFLDCRRQRSFALKMSLKFMYYQSRVSCLDHCLGLSLKSVNVK